MMLFEQELYNNFTYNQLTPEFFYFDGSVRNNVTYLFYTIFYKKVFIFIYYLIQTLLTNMRSSIHCSFLFDVIPLCFLISVVGLSNRFEFQRSRRGLAVL